MNRTRILAFKNKPQTPTEAMFNDCSASVQHSKPVRACRYISQGSNNVLAIALGNTVCLWDASKGNISELVAVDDEVGPVTSVRWAPDGRHIYFRILRGGHQPRVGASDWNNHILTTRGMDGWIVNNDVGVETYSGHHQEIDASQSQTRK